MGRFPMRSLPDSALSVLQNISTQEFASPADSAYYAPLLTQARDKNYVVQVDDSLIRYAVAHYDKVGMQRCGQVLTLLLGMCV